MTGRDPVQKPAFTRIDGALYLGIILFWGTSWIAIRNHLGVVAPEVSLVWRFTTASILMFSWALIRKERLRFSPADHCWFLAVALMLFSFNFLLQYYGGIHIKSGLMAVVFSLASIMNLFLGALVLHQPIEGRVLFGGLMGFLGVCFMFWPEISDGDINKGAFIGLFLCTAGTLCFCIGNMISTVIQRRGIPLIGANSWGMAYGTLILAMVSIFRGQPFIIEPTAKYLLSLLWLATGASVGAFFCYLTLLRRIGSARAGYATVLFPVVALVISTFVEGYHWTPLALAGAVLALSGNLFVLRQKSSLSKQ